jgi:hypothetical protein
MSEQVALSHSVVGVAQRTAAEVKHEADPGPWLFFAAPLSFVLTLLTVSWLSLQSF